MREIKALETHAYGCRFRSRLEARWATVLNALGIAWEYEPEGFALPSGNYLPDFYLSDARVYMEVKPVRWDDRAGTLLAELTQVSGAPCVLAGPLEPEPYGLRCTVPEGLIDMVGGEPVWAHLKPPAQSGITPGVWWSGDESPAWWTLAGDRVPEGPHVLAAWNAGRAFRHDDPRTHVKLRKTG